MASGGGADAGAVEKLCFAVGEIDDEAE